MDAALLKTHSDRVREGGREGERVGEQMKEGN